MGSKRGTSLRVLATSVVLSVGMAGVAGSAVAAEEELGLCRLFDIDAFTAATGQVYEQPPFWDLEENCKYVATSSPDGFHYVALQLTVVVPYDGVRGSASEAVDLEIGGHQAFASSQVVSVRDELRELVYVDLDGTTFIATLIAEEGTIPGQRDHVVRLAETAVAGLGEVGAAATEPPASSASVAAPELPTVNGIDWTNEWVGGGADLGDPASTAPLLEALGAGLSSLVVVTAEAESTEDGAPIGNITAIRVRGADQATLEGAVRTWLGGLLGVDEFETASVAGKDVAKVDAGPDQTVLVYVSGDTAVLVALEEPHAEHVLEALP